MRLPFIGRKLVQLFLTLLAVVTFNFLLFRVGDPDAVFNGLKQRAILIKNVSHMHPLLAGCLRTTIGTSVENDSFVQALRATLEGRK